MERKGDQAEVQRPAAPNRAQPRPAASTSPGGATSPRDNPTPARLVRAPRGRAVAARQISAASGTPCQPGRLSRGCVAGAGTCRCPVDKSHCPCPPRRLAPEAAPPIFENCSAGSERIRSASIGTFVSWSSSCVMPSPPYGSTTACAGPLLRSHARALSTPRLHWR